MDYLEQFEFDNNGQQIEQQLSNENRNSIIEPSSNDSNQKCSLNHSSSILIRQNRTNEATAVHPYKQYKSETTISDLPYDDIILGHILPLLSIDDLFNLKSVSWLFNGLINQYFKRLKKLNLSKCRCLTNGQFKFILSMNHNSIKQIDLSYNLSMNSRLVSKYLITYSLNQLTTIKLNDCHWIDRKVFTILFVVYGKQLESIECAGCWSVNDQIVDLLTICCSNLKKLNLSRIYSLTDQSLLYLTCHQSNNLKSLNLKHCWKLSHFAIYLLIKHCNQLVDLKIDQVHFNLLKQFSNGLKNVV